MKPHNRFANKVAVALALALITSAILSPRVAATPPTPSKVLTYYSSVSRDSCKYECFEDTSTVGELRDKRGSTIKLFEDQAEVLAAIKTDSGWVKYLLDFIALTADNLLKSYKTLTPI